MISVIALLLPTRPCARIAVPNMAPEFPSGCFASRTARAKSVAPGTGPVFVCWLISANLVARDAGRPYAPGQRRM
eukprot:5410387-Pyramimonas_sp.AAC.1